MQSSKTIRHAVGLLLLAATMLPNAATADEKARILIEQAVTGDHREADNAARDRYRHPKKTLLFLGWEPEMTVVEIWPSSGWYTEILAPITRPRGIYYAANFAMTADRTPDWRKDVHKAFMEKLEAHPDVYDHVVVTELSVPERTTIAPPGTADLALTFRNVHNWMKGEYAPAMFAVMHRALKPGGVLGVVEHRAAPGTSRAKMVESGYVTEAHVIELAENAGFELEARSEINANPADDKSHPAGVWTLPPSLRHCRRMDQGDQRDRCLQRYREIGESDRMTLRFRKPG
ncbi:methyltransferase [Salinisphaera sp. PC39]|uniref:class I SAM-dependent methyltransferase n=1 Tax=Salinisphaera sp. PC39 TaxID=1304156 RepID=UPI0033412846